MDDLSHKIDDLSRETHAEFQVVRTEMKDEFTTVRKEMKDEFRAFRSEIQGEFALIHGRFDGLQRSMILMMATILIAFASLVLAQL